jgi:Skp family chaperone for outer membrane proteins
VTGGAAGSVARPGGYGEPMALDDDLLAELKRTKAEIDRLQTQLKELVARLQEEGATNQEIAAALRG